MIWRWKVEKENAVCSVEIHYHFGGTCRNVGWRLHNHGCLELKSYGKMWLRADDAVKNVKAWRHIVLLKRRINHRMQVTNIDNKIFYYILRNAIRTPSRGRDAKWEAKCPLPVSMQRWSRTSVFAWNCFGALPKYRNRI
jgi:hypothetical protein